MIKIILAGKPKPKPAGSLKYSSGRAIMSMNKNGYKSYCIETIRFIQKQCKCDIQEPYGFVYHFIVPNLCRLGDMTNCMEAIQDCIVKSGIIKNDTPKIVNKVFMSLNVDKTFGYLTKVYICNDKIEYINTVIEVLK